MTGRLDDVALFRHAPWLAERIPWVRLGHWPTPVEPLAGLPGTQVPVYIKREDRSSPRYGGNKVRTLEAMLGRARALGAKRVWATGAYGSNHGVSTVIHAPFAGLRPGVVLFPQPPSAPAHENLLAMLSQRPHLYPLRHALTLPLAIAALRRRDPGAFVMPPGGATPHGALGALSAALELAEQVAAGVCPPPTHIVLAVGSACTSAGLLAGLHLARALGIGIGAALPHVVAVRVTPWPITSALRIAHLAERTSRRIAALTHTPAASLAELRRSLTVETRHFGRGYGQATDAGSRAAIAFEHAGAPRLDDVYSAKAGAALLELARRRDAGPLLFWATKSTAPLPIASADDLARAPRTWRRWLAATR